MAEGEATSPANQSDDSKFMKLAEPRAEVKYPLQVLYVDGNYFFHSINLKT